MIRVGSMFAGIGGLELGVAMALDRLGIAHEVAWQVERDAFCRRVLAKHWPGADRTVEDVRDASRATLPAVDLIVGGFPCQDVSSAGRGAGLAVGTRSGLWYEYRRVVDELRPGAAIVENVASGAARWLCEVRSDLHALGYRTRALGIGACDVGATHRRRRVFVVALADGDRERRQQQRSRWLPDSDATRGDHAHGCSGEDVPHPEREQLREQSGGVSWARREPGHDGAIGRPGAQPGVGRGAHGLSAWVVRRWPAGRGEPQHAWEPPRSVETCGPGRDVTRRPRLRAIGNAVVPACAEAVTMELARWISAEQVAA